MLFQGQTLKVWIDGKNLCHLEFDNKVGGNNVFNQQTLGELKNAYDAIAKNNSIKGLLLKSAKDHFILGADITEFMGHFARPDSEFKSWLTETNKLFSQFEDLPYPTVTAINGFALGGGLEICLTTDFRIMSETAKIGLLETKLGIIPGWGGTVRLSRLSGADYAIEWITSGNQYSAMDAFKIGAIDGVAAPANLYQVAETLLDRAIVGEFDWKKNRTKKLNPLQLNKIEATMVFETSKAFVMGLAGKNYPAPVAAVETIEKGARLGRDEALKIETDAFVYCAKTKTAESLVRVFLGDQYLKKVSKKFSEGAAPVKKAAVLGAGIMGGGISFQSASRGTQVLMKDIAPHALGLGMGEASKLLIKGVEKGKTTQAEMAKTLAMITPTLSYGDFGDVEYVVEAVVENEKIKKQVLSDVEKVVPANAILTSNTSTISITRLGENLARPENFCGMHFFNPVPRMPLVEIIRGKKTSEATIAKAVKYSLQMGKTPIVVNDCAGFLVNRVLFPYFFGFVKLITDGVDFQRIDKVMEKFGWPMGPAYLLDVIGVDTGYHAAEIMGDAFPERMKFKEKTILSEMYQNKKFGQKNGSGFFEYKLDKKGKLEKKYNPEVEKLIATVVKRKIEITDEQIVDRMMYPMIFECVRCLEDKIVESPIEVDMGLLLGLGFPPFRTGALKYADDVGISKVVETAKTYAELGALYSVPKLLSEMSQNGKKFY